MYGRNRRTTKSKVYIPFHKIQFGEKQEKLDFADDESNNWILDVHTFVSIITQEQRRIEQFWAPRSHLETIWHTEKNTRTIRSKVDIAIREIQIREKQEKRDFEVRQYCYSIESWIFQI